MGIYNRKMDDLGRIVLPRELRDEMGVMEGSVLKIWRKGGRLYIEKQAPFCALCGSSEELLQIKDGQWVCATCATRVDLAIKCNQRQFQERMKKQLNADPEAEDNETTEDEAETGDR